MKDKDKLIKNLSLRQGAIKILINSIYGAFGNKWFYFYDVDIAQSITLQGQDMIKFANKVIDFYFKNRWHEDTELHEKLRISHLKVNKIAENEIIAAYTDTDSFSFDTKVSVQCDEIIVKIESKTFKLNPNKKLLVLRNNKKINIKASDLLDTDLIDLDFI